MNGFGEMCNYTYDGSIIKIFKLHMAVFCKVCDDQVLRNIAIGLEFRGDIEWCAVSYFIFCFYIPLK